MAMPKPPTFLTVDQQKEWRSMYRAFRSMMGGRESVDGAFWKACEWYSPEKTLAHLGPKATFNLADYEFKCELDAMLG